MYQSKNGCKRWQLKITGLQKNCISDVVYGTRIYSFSQSHNGCHCYDSVVVEGESPPTIFGLTLVATTTLGAAIELSFFSETRWLARERPEDKQKNPCAWNYVIHKCVMLHITVEKHLSRRMVALYVVSYVFLRSMWSWIPDDAQLTSNVLARKT